MTKILSFFSASPKDLKIQVSSPAEIAEKMKKTDEKLLELPRSFAKKASEILEDDQVELEA